MQIRRTAAALTSAAALSVSGVAMATPAHAQPIITGGLVNVVVGDVEVLEDANIGVALGVAATLCDVNVNVLAVQLRNAAPTCNSDAGPVTIEQA